MALIDYKLKNILDDGKEVSLEYSIFEGVMAPYKDLLTGEEKIEYQRFKLLDTGIAAFPSGTAMDRIAQILNQKLSDKSKTIPLCQPIPEQRNNKLDAAV